MVLLAEGRLSSIGLRMAIASLLYIPDRVVAVIDSTKERTTVQEAVGFGGEAPIVHSLEEALPFGPDSLLIGITPLGGQLPESWRRIAREALGAGLHVVSGLKTPLAEDPEFQVLASVSGAEIIDLLTVSASHQIRAQGSWRRRAAKTILTVGSDSNTGKLTTALMMFRDMERRGIRVALIGTGPTGILISGRGIAVEAVPSDYLAGAVEFEVDRAVDEGHEYIIVEGQNALTNCGGSSIAIGLLHGTMPDAMILCHQPSRRVDGYGLLIPPLNVLIELHEKLVRVFKPGKVVGIGLNSMDLQKQELHDVARRITAETKLPAVDPLRESSSPLVEAVLQHFKEWQPIHLPQAATEIKDRTF
ncbi:MAG: DUF1611 domain-containing protein [Bacteroidota bacterium]|nr:DUF1611 domain-containing protein [Bacteroidota bacterium]